MKGPARVLGHAIHPILVVFPLGLLTIVPFLDVTFLATRNTLWAQMAFWMSAFGIIGGLLAAVAGLIDWRAIPRHTRAYRVGLTHMLVNVAAIAAYAVSFAFRLSWGATSGAAWPVVLAFIGLAIMAVGGWLGGELVEQHGVGVREGAHLDAPSSLDDRRLVRRPDELKPA